MTRTPAPRALSCGVVILNPARELLLCHVTGQRHWDIPKGAADPGETPRAAALRETREETGLVLDAVPLDELGRLPYTARKDLHLFVARVPRIDPSRLHCTTHFIDPHGRSRPEMDGYTWFDLERVDALCVGSMARLLQRSVDLTRWAPRPAADLTAPPILPRTADAGATRHTGPPV